MQPEKKQRTIGVILAGFSFTAYLPVALISIVELLVTAFWTLPSWPWVSRCHSILWEMHQAGSHPIVELFYPADSTYMFYLIIFFPLALLLCLGINVFVNIRIWRKPARQISGLWMAAFGIVIPAILFEQAFVFDHYESLPYVHLYILYIGFIGIGICLLADFIRCIRSLRKKEAAGLQSAQQTRSDTGRRFPVRPKKSQLSSNAMLAGLSFAAYLPFALIFVVLIVNLAIYASPWSAQYHDVLEAWRQTPGHPVADWVYPLESKKTIFYAYFAFPLALILCLALNVRVNACALHKTAKRTPALWMLAFGILLPTVLTILACSSPFNSFLSLSAAYFGQAIGAFGIGVCLLADLIRCIRLLRRHKDGA